MYDHWQGRIVRSVKTGFEYVVFAIENEREVILMKSNQTGQVFACEFGAIPGRFELVEVVCK